MRILQKFNSIPFRSYSINHDLHHIKMTETAMITKDGSHRFVRKGWEYSTYLGIIGGPLFLYFGYKLAPDTESEHLAREEALKLRKDHVKFQVKQRTRDASHIGKPTYTRGELGERPELQE